MRNRLAVMLLAVTVTACASSMNRFPVEASPDLLHALAGRWTGEYSGRRHGLIDFRLEADSNSAYGDVLMTDDSLQPATGMPSRTTPQNGAAAPVRSTILTIHFVHVDRGRVMGMLDPYWDRERGCEATATFYGVLRDGTMDGQFVSMCSAGMPALRGRWKVTRVDQER
jgi:hypothetical protein